MSVHSSSRLLPFVLLVVIASDRITIGQEVTLADTEIQRLVKKLDGDRYETRRKARKALVEMGTQAIPPIEQAIIENPENRELLTRGIEVLEALMLEEDDELHQAAVDSLKRIVTADSSGLAKNISNRVLANYAKKVAERAKAELQDLGARFSENGVAIQLAPIAPQQLTSRVIFPENWRGKSNDLERLLLLPGLQYVTFSGPQFTDGYLDYVSQVDSVASVVANETKFTAKGIAKLARLKGLAVLVVRRTDLSRDGDIVKAISGLSASQTQLIDAGCSDEVVDELFASNPPAKMKLHFGGFLGVGPVTDEWPDTEREGDRPMGCKLGRVEPGSAADAAGIRIDDIITKYDGKAINGFEELRDLIGRHGPGRPVVVEIERDGKTITKKVKLGEIGVR